MNIQGHNSPRMRSEHPYTMSEECRKFFLEALASSDAFKPETDTEELVHHALDNEEEKAASVHSMASDNCKSQRE